MTCIDVTLPPLAPNRPLLLVAAAALIDSEGRVLLAERPEGKSMAGLWEFPGGKVDAGELPEAALVRELNEELGITTSVGCLWPLAFASHGYEKFHLLMPLFGCRVWQGEPIARENQKLVWVPKDKLKDYPMPPADVGLVQALWELL
jgi:8-oxo-dGTP diphosphatase